MKRIISFIVIIALLTAGTTSTFAAEELNVNPQLNEPERAAMGMEQQESSKVLPGMSHQTGAVVLTTVSILAFAAVMISSDDGGTTPSHHSAAAHH